MHRQAKEKGLILQCEALAPHSCRSRKVQGKNHPAGLHIKYMVDAGAGAVECWRAHWCRLHHHDDVSGNQYSLDR
jgi:hypothetical protein